MKPKTIKTIVHGVVQLSAIFSLTYYGTTLAKLGIDSQVALTIGLLIGGIAGVSLKSLYDIVKK